MTPHGAQPPTAPSRDPQDEARPQAEDLEARRSTTDEDGSHTRVDQAADEPTTLRLRPVRRNEWEREVRRMNIQPPARKLLALTLATFADPDGTSVRPGEELLAQSIGRSTRQVRTHMTALRDELRLLERVVRGSAHGRGGVADEYRLTLPPAAPISVAPNTGSQASGVRGGTPEAQSKNTGSPATGTPEAQTSAHQPETTSGPLPGNSQPTTTALDPRTLVVVEALPSHVRNGLGLDVADRFVRDLSDAWTEQTLTAEVRRRGWNGAGPGVAIDWLKRLPAAPEPRVRGLEECGHGKLGGNRVIGAGRDASRYCTDCEVENPAFREASA